MSYAIESYHNFFNRCLANIARPLARAIFFYFNHFTHFDFISASDCITIFSASDKDMTRMNLRIHFLYDC